MTTTDVITVTETLVSVEAEPGIVTGTLISPGPAGTTGQGGAPLRLPNLLGAGHSFMAGVGQTHTKRSIVNRIAALAGVDAGHVLDLAVSGAALRSAETNGAARYLQALNAGELNGRPLVAHISAAAISFLLNDLILGNSAANMDCCQGNLEALVSRLIHAAAYDYNSATVASSGTWATTLYSAVDKPYGSGLGMSSTTEAGASKTITPEAGWDDYGVAGAWFDFRFITESTDNAVVTVTPAGEAATVHTIRRQFWPGEHGLDNVRVWVPAGTATVTVVATTITAGAVRFDGYDIEATVPGAIAIHDVVLPPNLQWIWAGIDAADVASANVVINNVVDIFAGDADTPVPSVFDVALGDILDVNGVGEVAYFSNDGLHPNDRGALAIAGLTVKAIHDHLIDLTVTREGLAAWWYDEADPITSVTIELAHGNGAPQELVDDFDRDEATTPGALWVEQSGGWGILSGQLAAYSDRVPYPDFLDTFDRADGDPGASWVEVAGQWDIDTNVIRHTSGAGGFLRSARAMPSGDGVIGYTSASAAASDAGVFFRRSDASNYWRALRNATFGTWFLSKTEAGSSTLALNPIYIGGSASGTDYLINLAGQVMTFYVNGVQVNTYTHAFNENATEAGLYNLTAGNAYRWDAFRQLDTPIDTSIDPGYNLATTDLGDTIGAVSFTVGQDRANFHGVSFRYLDDENYLALYMSVSFGGWVLVKRVAGGAIATVNAIPGDNSTGTIVTIDMLTATTFRIYFDGVESSAGLQTIADAPAGTLFGPRCNFRVITTTAPAAILDDVRFGDVAVVVADGQHYRDDTTGTIYGPFIDGVPLDNYAWLPTNTAAAGLDEVIRDVIGATLLEAGDIDITVNDAGDTITINVTGIDAELVRDAIGSALVSGTGITVTVNDPADTITVALDLTVVDERIRDTIGAALVAGDGITITPNDGADTITVTGTPPAGSNLYLWANYR